MNIDIGVKGFYNFVVRKANGSVKKDYGWQPNLILDSGLNNIGAVYGAGNTCFVGSGSNAPLVSNTALQNPVGSTTSVQSNLQGYSESAPYYGWNRKTFRFRDGSAAGNLSEVGIGSSTAESTLFSRALILDGAGNPTTITVLGDETLDVTYELRLYPPTADATFNLTLAGTVHACRMRPANVNSNLWSPLYLLEYGTNQTGYMVARTGDIGTQLESAGGDYVGQIVGNALPYSNNSRKRGWKFDAELNDINHELGIKSVVLSLLYDMLGYWQCSFTPPIPKDNTKKLSLTFEISWNRFTPA